MLPFVETFQQYDIAMLHTKWFLAMALISTGLVKVIALSTYPPPDLSTDLQDTSLSPVLQAESHGLTFRLTKRQISLK